MLLKPAKYTYGESILKGNEGGTVGGVGLLLRLNIYMNKEYRGRLEFVSQHSPFVGHWAPTIYATDLEALKYGLSFARQYGFFDSDTIKKMVEESKHRVW